MACALVMAVSMDQDQLIELCEFRHRVFCPFTLLEAVLTELECQAYSLVETT